MLIQPLIYCVCLITEGRRKTTGNWQLVTGNWQLATGNRQLVTRTRQPSPGNLPPHLPNACMNSAFLFGDTSSSLSFFIVT